MAKFAAKDSNKNITLSPHGTGKVVVGTGSTDATVQSDGNHNLVLQTGNATTGSITITDGADGNIAISPNGTGTVVVNTDLDVDNININGNAITSTNTDGNIDLTPNGTGEVNISKVDIDAGNISGTDIDVSSNTLTTSSAQKTAIVDGGKGNLTKSDVGLSNVTNDAQVPASGGNFSGDVGIGVSGSIANKLHVEKAGTTVATFRTSNSNSSGGIELGGKNSGGTLQPFYLQSNASAELKFLQGSSATERMSVNSSGNLKIGNGSTITPDSNADDLVIDKGTTDTGLSILSTTTGRVYFGDANSDEAGSIRYVHTDNSMRFETDSSEQMRIDSSGNLKFNSGFGSVATAFGCRAWVHYDQINDNVLGSGNISSVTDNSTGNFTINFSNPMPDTNYCVLAGNVKTSGDTSPRNATLASGNVKSTSAVQIIVEQSTGSNEDEFNNSVAIFR